MGHDASASGKHSVAGGKIGGLWSVVATVTLFTCGAAMFGIGVGLAFAARSPWDVLSHLLLGSALMLMSVGVRREAMGNPIGLILRFTVTGLTLAAAALHFLLV